MSSAATCSSGACVPAARVEVDREVDAAGEQPRVADPERDRALDGQLLEVGRADVEEERQLAVVDRDLGHGGVDRPEPERQPGAVASELTARVLDHVSRRLGPEVTQQGERS